MRVAVVGAGPTGLLLGAGLARRGHEVTLVDRDKGPAPDGTWVRRGVMQFRHAHVFRGPLVAVLREELPEAYDAWLAAGAAPAHVSTPAGEMLAGVHSQRETFERVLRASAAQVPGLALRTAHVDRIEVEAGRASGLRIGSEVVGADLVVDATGRSGRTSEGQPERDGIGGPCGIAYVDRIYRLRPGEGPGPMVNAIIYGAFHDGYEVLVAPHEHGLFSVVILRRHDDRALAALRVPALFDRAVAAIPSLAAWAAADRADPVTDPLPGANLVNRYRSQGDLPGLAFVGDSVCTTTPNFGRGVTTSFLQVAALLRQVDEHGADLAAALAAYAGWCEESMRPWVEDHIVMDGALARRWGGEPLDLDQPVPTDLVVAAAEQDPGIGELIAPFLAMQVGPASLGPARARARAVYAGGWRPAYPPGPTRDELADLLG